MILSAKDIRQGVKTLALALADVCPHTFELIGIMDASFMFVADLCRELHKLHLFPRVRFIQVKSYRGTKRGRVKCNFGKLGLKDKFVLVVDTIVDSGETMKAVLRRIKRESPAFVVVCALVSRVSFMPDVLSDAFYFAHKKEEGVFYVGYGLDYDGYLRELPRIVSFRAKLLEGSGYETYKNLEIQRRT